MGASGCLPHPLRVDYVNGFLANPPAFSHREYKEILRGPRLEPDSGIY